MGELEFIRSAFPESADGWAVGQLQMLASIVVPDSVYGRRAGVVRGDMTHQWANWFVESILDPRGVADQGLQYPSIFAQVFRIVDRAYPNHVKTTPEKKELAAAAARIVRGLASRLTSDKKRGRLAFDERKLALDLAGNPPRCWICGAEFRVHTIDRFLYGGAKQAPSLPSFVDILRPRGLNERDLQIEVDHVIPLSRGGEDGFNLRLACGWCNRYKSARQSLFDAEGQPIVAGANAIGLASVPQPFWTIRLLGLMRRCEHPEGCERTSADSELTVVPINFEGAPNPINLRVTCSEHDPYLDRFQPPSVARSVWRSNYSENTTALAAAC